jgi:hypothetical protein
LKNDEHKKNKITVNITELIVSDDMRNKNESLGKYRKSDQRNFHEKIIEIGNHF